jgi:O-antigen/teichoic acid export membrane protein
MVCALAAVSTLIRAIGIAGYGHFSVITITASLLVAVLGLGVGTLVMRDLVLEDPKKPALLESAWHLRHVSSALYVVLGSATAFYFYAQGQHQLAEVSLLLGVAVPYMISGNLAAAAAYSYGNATKEAAVETVAKLLWVTAVVLIYVLHGPWLVAAAASFLLNGLSLLARRWITGRHLQPGASIGIKKTLAASAPLALFPFIYLAFDHIDILGLAVTAPATTVGRYSACYQFADALIILAGAAMVVLQPTFSAPSGRRDRHQRSRRRLLIAISWLSALGIASAPTWLWIIAGNQLGSSYTALATVALLGTGTIAYVAAQCDALALVAARRHAIIFSCFAAGAVLEFSLVAWLGHHSIAITAFIVCAIEMFAVLLSSHLCTRTNLSFGFLSGATPGILAGATLTALEFALGPTVPVSFVATALCLLAAALTPSVRTEAISTLGHIPLLGPRVVASAQKWEVVLHLRRQP